MYRGLNCIPTVISLSSLHKVSNSITSAEYSADLWAQTLTSSLKCKRDLKKHGLSINRCGRGWEVGASNICLAFIHYLIVLLSPLSGLQMGSWERTEPTVQGTHTVTGNMAGTSSQSSMVYSRLFARPLMKGQWNQPQGGFCSLPLPFLYDPETEFTSQTNAEKWSISSYVISQELCSGKKE